MPRRVEKLNLGDHTLDIEVRRRDITQFDFSEVEDYISALAGGREYQFEAIKNTLIYLWGGIYKDITDLARKNFKNKIAIRQRFHSEENFLRHLPLPDRLSGVVHMATGTGKSYVIFAIAYLSIVMGKVKRVLVLGPSSTIIEQGLTGKFREYLYGPKGLALQEKLPAKYRGIAIQLLNENDPITDNSIVIENINSIYNKENNSIGQTLFLNYDNILVLSDEVHHAYSHLKYGQDSLAVEDAEGKGEERDERLWMKFLREEKRIKRHIGFTGTPYNQDEYFADVIYDYSIRDAMTGRQIKHINPIIKTESDEDTELTLSQRFEQILITHYENKSKYSYSEHGQPRLKPISIFINSKQSTAEKNKEEFTKALCDYLRKIDQECAKAPEAVVYQKASDMVICVISKPTDDDYQEKLDAIEETDPAKVGGKVEFIFAVNKLSEGWDVDNVYQIVPMEERIFDSKLLISQVLGRGLRLPRKVPFGHILSNYPVVTITNHEKFADHIKELLYAVTDCDTRFISRMLTKESGAKRAENNFMLFNLNYVSQPRLEEPREPRQDMQDRALKLESSPEKLELRVTYMLDKKSFSLTKNFYTIDQVVEEIFRRFETQQFERASFDFGDGITCDDLPDRDIIEQVIRKAMEKAEISGDRLSEENKKRTELFFNQFLPRGKKRRVLENIEGDTIFIKTAAMDMSSIRSGELDKDASVFISEEYETELDKENLFVIEDFNKRRKDGDSQQATFDFAGEAKSEYIRSLVPGKPLYVVNASLFKTPQNLVIVSHGPERDFVFQLVDNAKYIDAWIKSRNMDFYSMDYEFWKGGKDRVRRSFNPDFFLRFDLQRYIDLLTTEGKNIKHLQALQDQGKKEIVIVVEIKSDEDQDEVTRAKERYGQDHFHAVNKRLDTINAIDIPEDFRNHIYQHYSFFLLTPEHYSSWFGKLRSGMVLEY
jgi:type III restriction enzyme